ncbi:MAG: phosphatase PAP2 family protein [Bdellovibrionales bacterium]
MTPSVLAMRKLRILKTAVIITLFIALETVLVLFVDRPLTASIRNIEASTPEMIRWFKAITDFGKSIWYLYPSGLGALICLALIHLPKNGNNEWAKTRFAATGGKLTTFFAVIALSGIITDGLKWLIGRARPVLDLRSQIYEFQPLSFDSTWNSMPSGHATTSIALAISLCWLWPRGRVFWLALGGLLAASRVMVCAHYLSDILAGGLIAAIVANKLLLFCENGGMLPCVHRLFPSDRQAHIRQEARKSGVNGYGSSLPQPKNWSTTCDVRTKSGASRKHKTTK